MHNHHMHSIWCVVYADDRHTCAPLAAVVDRQQDKVAFGAIEQCITWHNVRGLLQR